VAAERVLEPTAERIAMDGSHDRLVAPFHNLKGRALRHGSRLAELADVGTGNEAAPCPDHDHRLDGRIGLAFLQRLHDAVADTGPQRVDGRVVDGDDADPVLHVERTRASLPRPPAFPQLVSSAFRVAGLLVPSRLSRFWPNQQAARNGSFGRCNSDSTLTRA
jgi:hypothetical protein